MSEWDVRVIIFCLGSIITGMGFVLVYLSRIEVAMKKMENLLTDIRNSHDHAEGFRRLS